MQIQSERFGINNPKDFEIQADFTFYQISDIYNYLTRVIVYLVGLFIMTIGVSMSVKSNLGVSPVSSIPYTITCITGLEMGKATILFHIVLVIIQIIIFKNLLQVFVGIIFGYFTTFSNYLFSFIPSTENYVIRAVLMLGSTVVIAFGIFLYLPADVVPLAGEGAMKAISDKTGIMFSHVKIGFDISMVLVSLAVCLIALRKPGAVGVGTVVAAVIVGIILGRFNHFLGAKKDKLLGKEKE